MSSLVNLNEEQAIIDKANLGANFSSWYTTKVNRAVIKASVTKDINMPCQYKCPTNISGSTQTTTCQSQNLTPAEYAKFPKVAIPSSVLTESRRVTSVCANGTIPDQRFSHYRRYEPPTPCLPLPQTANMAGISKPSTRQCNLYSI